MNWTKPFVLGPLVFRNSFKNRESLIYCSEIEVNSFWFVGNKDTTYLPMQTNYWAHCLLWYAKPCCWVFNSTKIENYNSCQDIRSKPFVHERVSNKYLHQNYVLVNSQTIQTNTHCLDRNLNDQKTRRYFWQWFHTSKINKN